MPVDMFYLFAIYLMLDKTFTSEWISFNELLLPCDYSLFILGLLNLAAPCTGLPFLYPTSGFVELNLFMVLVLTSCSSLTRNSLKYCVTTFAKFSSSSAMMSLLTLLNRLMTKDYT